MGAIGPASTTSSSSLHIDGEWGKNGQTVRQSMPFNAHYAFMQAGKNSRYSQKTRTSCAKIATYSSTIGVLRIDLFELEVSSASFEGGKSRALRIGLGVAGAGSLDVEHNMILGRPPTSL